MDDISINKLKEYLNYNSETGIFTWVKNSRKIKAGTTAGNSYKRKNGTTGYIRIGLLGKSYSAHRLAWFYVYGEWPKETIDHINGDGFNNKISNLRSVSIKENLRNRRIPKTNSSGVVGVTWHKPNKKWQARIEVNGKKLHLGMFDDLEDARLARHLANKEYGFHSLHGTKKECLQDI